jgi:hypothetical protein
MYLILRISVSTIFLFLVSSSVIAQDTKTATITSKEPKPVRVDSVVPELQGIIVLCATEPDSAEFADQWRNYIRRHKTSKNDLGPLIFRVINEAEAYRGNKRLNRRETPDASRDRRAKMYRMLHDTAMAVIRIIG